MSKQVVVVFDPQGPTRVHDASTLSEFAQNWVGQAGIGNANAISTSLEVDGQATVDDGSYGVIEMHLAEMA